jgi:hypothetical protein
MYGAMAGSGCTTMRLGGVGEREAHQCQIVSVGCRGAGLDRKTAQEGGMGISGCSASLTSHWFRCSWKEWPGTGICSGESGWGDGHGTDELVYCSQRLSH